MSDMIERVARAIHFRGDDQGDGAWSHCQPWLRMVAREQARAAIEAMREPTEAMVASGESAASFGIGKPKDEAAIPRVWRWMIDASLSNSKGGEG